MLPYNLQFVIPHITCATLNQRPAGSIPDPAQRTVACDATGTKYLLDIAKVTGTDLADAQATLDTQTGAGWKVDLKFDGPGSDRWALTFEAFNNTGDPWTSGAGTSSVPANPNCLAVQPAYDGSRNLCMVGVVLDNKVITAPAIQGVLSTQSSITGQFDEAGAHLLASQLKLAFSLWSLRSLP